MLYMLSSINNNFNNQQTHIKFENQGIIIIRNNDNRKINVLYNSEYPYHSDQLQTVSEI